MIRWHHSVVSPACLFLVSLASASLPAEPRDLRSSPDPSEKLPPGYVRGDVVSYSYVPIRT